MNQSVFDPNKLSIIAYNILKGNIIVPDDFEIENVISVEADNSLTMGFNHFDSLVRADLTVNLKTVSSDATSEAESYFVLSYIFHIDNYNQLIILDKNDIPDVNYHLASAIASVSYSTSRGVLLTRLQGTPFQKFILPIIDPTSLIQKDVR